MKNIRTILLLMFAGMQLNVFSQDIHFSQFAEAPLLMNPAQAGDFLGDHRAGMIYRNQWSSVSVPFSTFSAYYDCALFDKKWSTDYMGIGASFLRDQAGDARLGTTNVSLSLSYFMNLSPENTIALGIQPGFVQRSADLSKIQWDSQFDGFTYNSALSSQEYGLNEGFSYFDFSGGLTWNYAQPSRINAFRSTVGVAAYHINGSEQHFLGSTGLGKNQNTRWVVFATAETANRSTNVYYVPSIFFQKQGAIQELVLGGLLGFQLNEGSKITGWIRESSFYVGGYYRFNDALIFATTLQLHSYSISFSYDFNLSELSPASNSLGGFEVSLIYKTPYIPRWKKGKSRY